MVVYAHVVQVGGNESVTAEGSPNQTAEPEASSLQLGGLMPAAFQKAVVRKTAAQVNNTS